jgi:hypothetical protein
LSFTFFGLIGIFRVNDLVILFHESGHFPADSRKWFGVKFIIFPQHQVTKISFKNVAH